MSERIPQDFIDDLIERADVSEVIGKRVEIKKAGKEYKACCPFHNEKTPSFTVSPEKGFYHCFGCGAHGTALGFLMDYERLTFVEAIEELAKMVGIPVPITKEDRVVNKENNDLKSLLSRVSKHYEKNLKESTIAIEYFKSRGIDGKTARHYALGFAKKSYDDILKNFGKTDKDRKQLLACGLLTEKDDGGYFDKFRNRVMFPIRNNRGEVVGFGGRVIADEEPKYLNSPGTVLFKKGELLYGLFESKKSIAERNSAIIVEGYTDVIGLYQFGVGNSLATLGTATTDNHINKIFRISDQIIFCFDGDDAGRKAAEKAMKLCLPLVRKNKEAYFLILEDEDPDEFIRKHGHKQFEARLATAQSTDEFLINICNKTSDITSVKGKANAIENAMALVNTIQDGIYKDLMVEKIASEYNLTLEKLVNYVPSQKITKKASRTDAQRNKPAYLKNRPSLINQAIRILLHKPELGKIIDLNNQFKHLDQKGVNVLREIIQLIHAKDSIKLATIIEHFQDQKLQRYLSQLAMDEGLINKNEMLSEFNDITQRLNIQDLRKELTILIERAKNKSLNDQDARRLKELSKNIK
ncbi:MAG TPA: DNA primase [Gammaproteobacteria bacterium]|nr:DNA primase [Gammaproteobacteria bacterium]